MQLCASDRSEKNRIGGGESQAAGFGSHCYNMIAHATKTQWLARRHGIDVAKNHGSDNVVWCAGLLLKLKYFLHFYIEGARQF